MKYEHVKNFGEYFCALFILVTSAILGYMLVRIEIVTILDIVKCTQWRSETSIKIKGCKCYTNDDEYVVLVGYKPEGAK